MAETDDRPATKGDLEVLRGELYQVRDGLRAEMHQIRDELRGEMRQMRDEIIEQMRDMQTELLRAFYAWARPLEIRVRSLPGIEERLGLLEERVSRIERGEGPPRLT